MQITVPVTRATVESARLAPTYIRNIHAAIKAELTLRKLAALEVRACTSSCLDPCWAGPVVMVSPGGTVYGRLTEGDVSAFVDALESGVGLERWTLPPADFDKDTAGPSLPELPEPPSPSGTT